MSLDLSQSKAAAPVTPGAGNTNVATEPKPAVSGAVSKGLDLSLGATPAPKTPVAKPAKGIDLTVSSTPKIQPDYFYKKYDNGATVGRSDDLDVTGNPLFAYRNPGDKATTTDRTRIATTFDPTVAQPLTKEQYYNNPRIQNLRDKYEKVLGIKASEELDHAIALTVGGSNQPENLRAIPTEENQAAGKFELELAQKLAKGEISYMDAQIADAQHKGIKVPWEPPKEHPGGIWGAVKDKIKSMFATPVEAADAGDTPLDLSQKIDANQYKAQPSMAQAIAGQKTAQSTVAQSDAGFDPAKAADYLFKQKSVDIQPAFAKPSEKQNVKASQFDADVYNNVMRIPEFFAGLIPKIFAVLQPDQKASLPVDAGRLTGAGGEEGQTNVQTFGQDYLDAWAKMDGEAGLTGKEAINVSNPQSLVHGIISAALNIVQPSLAVVDGGEFLKASSKGVLADLGYKPTLKLKGSTVDGLSFDEAKQVVNDRLNETLRGIGTEFPEWGPKAQTKATTAVQEGLELLGRNKEGAESTASAFGEKVQNIAIALNEDVGKLGKVDYAPAPKGAKALPGMASEEPRPNVAGFEVSVGASIERRKPVGQAYPDDESLKTINSNMKDSASLASDDEHAPEATPESQAKFEKALADNGFEIVGNGESEGTVIKAKPDTSKEQALSFLKSLQQNRDASLTLQTTKDGDVVLYHGTASKGNLESILKNGFKEHTYFSTLPDKYAGGVGGAKEYGDHIVKVAVDPRDLELNGLSEFMADPAKIKSKEAFTTPEEKKQPVAVKQPEPLTIPREELTVDQAEGVQGWAVMQKLPSGDLKILEEFPTKATAEAYADTAPKKSQPEKRETHADREAANKKYVATETKAELEKAHEKHIAGIKADPELEAMSERLASLQGAIESHPAKELVKYANKSTGELPEVTGDASSIFGRRGDDIVTELGFKDSESARAGIRTFRSMQQKALALEHEIQIKKLAIRDKVKKAEDEAVLSRVASVEDKRISKIIGDEAEKKARIERVQKAEEESAKKLREEEDFQAQRRAIIKKAHMEARKSKGFMAKVRATFGPIGNTDETTQKIWRDWEAKRISAKEAGNRTVEDFEKRGFGDINDIEKIMEYQAGAQTAFIREFYDDLWTEGRRRGLETPYRENYFTQVYKEGPREVKEKIAEFLKKEAGLSKDDAKAYVDGDKELPEYIAIRLKMQPSFVRARTFPDYATAMRYGLTPKFLTIPEHFAYYRTEMEKVIANKEMIEAFVKDHKFLDSADAPDSWIEVKVPGQARRHWYASPDLANALNKQFQLDDEETMTQFLTKIGSKVAGTMMDIKLAGGIPYTPINYFAVSQAIRALTTSLGAAAKLDFPVAAAELRAAGALVRSFSTERSVEWFKSNQRYIDMMAKHNIEVESRAGAFDDLHDGFMALFKKGPNNRQALLKDAGKSIIEGKNNLLGLLSKEGRKSLFGDETGGAIDKIQQFFEIAADSKAVKILSEQYNGAMNRKTFQVMMPMMKVQIFKDIYAAAKRGGLEDDEASAYAAQIVKKEFGIIEMNGRAKAVQNTINSFMQAPKFRESLINTFGNMVKGTTWRAKDPAYRNNRAFALGAILSFGIYQLINYSINHEFTWDNENGRKFSIKIPFPNGDIGYVEYLPSIFATPRMAVQAGIALAQGDIGEALHQGSGVFSMPVSLAADTFTNSDHFGRPVYIDAKIAAKTGKPEDSAGVKIRKSVEHIGSGFVHPYISELTNYFQGGEPLYQALSIMGEIPVKFSNEAKESRSKYFDELTADQSASAKQKASFVPTYTKIRNMVLAGDKTGALEAYNALSDSNRKVYDSLKRGEDLKRSRDAEQAIYSTVKKVRGLIDSGKTAEGTAIYNTLPADQKKAYDAVKKKFFSN